MTEKYESEITQAAPAPRSLLQRIFITAAEPRLRLVWRFALYALISFLFSLILTIITLAILYFVVGRQDINLLLVSIIPSALGTASAIFISRRLLDRRSIRSLGLIWDATAVKDLLVGIGITAVMMGLVFIVEYSAGWLQLQGMAPLSLDTVLNLLLWLAVFLLVGFYEELFARGYLFQNLNEHFNDAITLAATALVFSLGHLTNPHASLASIIGIFVAGLFLGSAYVRTRQLWLSIGLHIGWNFLLGPVFGFPVSGLDTFHLLRLNVSGPVVYTGGSFGPEAGLVLLPALVVGTLLVYLYSRDRGKEQPSHE